MNFLTKHRVFFFCWSKIVFILVFIIPLALLLSLSSCSSKKKKKNKASVVYSLPPYPLTTYYIQVDKDSLAYIYEHFDENYYIPVSLKIGNEVYEGVKMRIRGDSSRKMKKKSLKLKLPKGKKLDDGASKINLNADYGDYTFVHQYLASKIMNDNNQICFRSGYAPVYVNGAYFGLYLRVENMDSAFLKKRNLSTKNNMYKATRDYACMVNKSEVDKRWEKKSNLKEEGSDDLKDLIDQLNAVPIEGFEVFAKTHFFYDEMVNMIALNMLVSNSSTYYHNYYMYHDRKKDKWRMFPWDMDKTFNPVHVDFNYQKTSWAEGKSSAINTNTLVEKFLANRNTLLAIRSRIDTLKSTFNSSTYAPQINDLKIQLESYLLKDETNKIKSKERWVKRLDELLTYIDARPDALLKQIDNKPINFMVNRTVKIVDGAAVITWDKSIDPNGLPITYTIHYSNLSGFKGDLTGQVAGLTSPAGTIKNLPSGKYYFYVEASNKIYKTYGHDIRNFFVIP